MVFMENVTRMRIRLAILVYVVATLVFAPLASRAEDRLWLDPERMLGGIAMIESSGGKFLVGDGGKSLGVHQISREAWEDVNRARSKARLGSYDYDHHVFNPAINRAFARDYLMILQVRLAEALGKVPAVEQVYASFNMGFERFAQVGFNLSRVNPVTRRNSYAVRKSYENSIPQLASVQVFSHHFSD